MIAQELEVTLHMAFVQARGKRHEFITVEHLLLSLLDNPTARKVLRGCGADAETLRKNLTQYIAEKTPRFPDDREVDTQPTVGFQRVIQHAILHVQSSGKKEVMGSDVLVAIFGDKDSHAVRLLQDHGVTRRAVASHVSRGVTKRPKPVQEELAEPPAAQPGSAYVIGQELRISLDSALAAARQKRHEFITVEHLVLALLENPTVEAILRACGANMDALAVDLAQHITEQTPLVPTDRPVNTQPTLGYQRVIQRALLHVQSLGQTQITGAAALVAVFGERDSHAVYFLQKHGITRVEVVNYLAGVDRTPEVHEELGNAADVQVVLYRDDHTPMEFLVRVLLEFFALDRVEAAETLLEIYRDGKAVCGLYSRDAGETTVKQVLAFAREHSHPLRCGMVAPK
jgi:ATP-dependent Clp protease ATP-binding subunit ClpA